LRRTRSNTRNDETGHNKAARATLGGGGVVFVFHSFPSAPVVARPLTFALKMHPALQSQIFEQFDWDNELPEWPTLNAICRDRPDGEIEVSFVGDSEMTMDWSVFLERSEAAWQLLMPCETRLLADAAPEIYRKHRAYFVDRWESAPEDLIAELSLRLVCFYSDGSVHLWYAGTAMFNLLDVDLGLDSDLRLTEVRFDA
jgi:hypothetical protein